jgi:membrane protease YdiL (CAAX protease family)
MRGFIFRLAYQWDMARREGVEEALATALDERSVAEVSPGAWTFAAASISTVAFTAGHQMREWPAALAFGALMIGLWVWRKDLLSCIAAHGVANVGLALYVRSTGAWGLW